MRTFTVLSKEPLTSAPVERPSGLLGFYLWRTRPRLEVLDQLAAGSLCWGGQGRRSPVREAGGGGLVGRPQGDGQGEGLQGEGLQGEWLQGYRKQKTKSQTENQQHK